MWGASEHRGLWAKGPGKLGAFRSKSGTSYTAWTALRQYPALLSFYAGGIAALHTQNFENLKALLFDLSIEVESERQPCTSALHPLRILPRNVTEVLPESKGRVAAPSHHLHLVLRQPLKTLIHDDEDYEILFDQYEYLQGLAGIYRDSSPYLGRFTVKLRYPIEDLRM